MANVYEQGQEYTKGLFDAALDKQTQLQQARDNKLAALTNSKPITIAGYDDADTIKSTDNTTYRLQAADGTMYDSIESKHGTKPIDMQGGTGAYQKSPAAMTKQRQLVSSMVGKPESALTEQDFVDVSNWQLVQAMADQANGAGKWEAPFGTGTAPLNMSGKFKDANGQRQEAPLDIPATVKTMGKDKAGRTLGVLGTADGFDATTTAAHDPKRNIYSNTAPVTPSGAEANKQKAYDALAGAYGTKVTSQIANAGKAFAYRAAEGIAQTLDLVPEVVEYGYKNLTKNPNANWSDMEGLFSDTTSAKLKNFLGYDDHRMQALAEEAKTAVTNAYDKGDYWGVLKALGHAVLTPEVTGESMGFLASMILPGTGALKALRVSSGVTKGVKAAVAAEEAAAVEAGIAITAAERTAMTAKALKEAEESAGVGYTLAKVVAENPGYINYAEQVARDSEKEYKEKYGTEMDGTRRTGAFLLGLASGKLDAAMGTALIKGTDPLAKLIRAAWVEAPEAVQKSTAIAIVKATGMPMARVVGAMAEEGFTEGLQTALENTAAKYNSTAKGGSLGEIFTDKDNLTDIGRDALIGAAGGAQFAGPSIAKDVVGKAAGKMVDGVQKVADKMASNKPEAVAARAQAEEVTVAQQASKTMFNKVNLMTPDQKAKFVVSLDALAVADDSPESIEIKNIATDVLQGKDDKGILGADVDDAEAGRRITNAIMSADGSIIANIDNVVENVQKLRPNMDNAQVVDIVGNAFVVRQAMDTLQSMKTTDEVGKEVAEGDRGFNTYFRNIMQARAVGDVAAAEEYTTKLETFQAKQESKIRTIQGLVSTMEQQLHSAAQAAVDASGGDISYAAGLKAATERLGEQSRVKSRGKVGKVSYGTGVFEMSYRTVAERMQMDESAQATFNGGGFSGLNNMIRELDAMNVLSAEVHGTRVATQRTAPTAQPAAPLKDRIKAWVDKQLAAEGATIETVKAKVDGLAEDKAESKQLANDYISELLLDNTIEELSTESAEITNVAIELNPDVVPDIETVEEFDWSVASEEILEDMNADLYDGSVKEVGEVEIPTDNVYDMLYTGDEGMSLEYDENEYSALMFGDNVEHNAEVKQLVRDQSTIEDELDTALANEASEEVVSEIQGRLKALREKLKEYRQYADKLVSEISKRYGGKFFTVQGLKNIVEGKTVQDQLLKASNVTKLAASEVAILPEAQKLVTQALKHLGLNVSENGTVTDPTASSLVSSKGLLLANNKIVQNPALALLIKPVKVDGVYKAVVDSNVANAMYAAQMSYLADNVGEFTMGKTDDEMFEMFAGFKAYDPINPDAVFVDIQRYGGMFAKFAAADAGAEVMTYLGLKAGALSIPELHQGFVAGFGAMLVNGMIDDGLLKVVKIDNALVLMAAKNDENKVALFDAKIEIVREARRFENEYLVDANKGRGPSMTPQSADRRVTIHHQPYANATDIQTEAVHTLEQLGMQVNEGYDVLMDVFGDEATLLREVGVEEINEETQTFDTRESLEASNRAHTDAVGYLKSAYEKFKGVLMYFKWFVTKGGRFNLDSTEVNPQTNKQLHRWLVTAADAMTTMKTVDVIALANYEEGQKLPELAVAFAYGLAQGFGIDVEKETEHTVLMEAKRLVNMTKAELIVHARDKMSTAKAAGKRAFAHPGQLAVAIAAVDRFRTAENGEFTTSLTVEFDGLTNGFSFKIMQYPLNDYKMWLPKIGVLLEGSQYYHHESMNSVKADKVNKLQDTYETIGSVMVPRLFTRESKAQDVKVAMVWTRPKGLTDTPRATEQQVITAAELSDKLISNEIAPDMKIVNGVVSSTVRNIMKNPAMIFNYAAGITKIIDNVTTNMVTDTIDKVYQLAQNDPAKFTEIFGIEDAQGVALALKTEPLSSKSNAMIRTKLYDAYKIMYGIPVGEALESKFKSYIKLNKALNEAFSFMYSVFKKNVPDVATELYKAGRLESHYGSEKLVKGLTLDALSTADAIIVIREMVARGMAPAVASPDTNTRMQQLVVFDRAVADIKKAATTKDDLEAPRNARVMMDSNGKEDTYLSLFTRVVGEPGAAGGVLMTHTKDGLAIGKTIIEHPHLGVHDASVWGLHQMMEGTRAYNKNWYDINKMFSDVDAVLDALTRTMKFDKVVNGTKLDASDTIATLKRYQQTISKNRVELYTTNAKIGQQVGTNGSMYEVDANKQRAEALKEVVSTLAEISAGLSRQGQAAVKAAVNKYKDSPIALINNVLDIVGKNTVEYDKLARLKDRVKTMIATTTTARDTAVETEQDVETYTQPAVTPKVPTTPKPVYTGNTAAAELAAKLTKVNAKAASTMIDDSKDC